MDTCDTIIHVRAPLTTEQQLAIEMEMREAEGVIAPRFTLPGALAVVYDPERISAMALLGMVRRRGLPASLVAI
jgi:hypothetical protein